MAKQLFEQAGFRDTDSDGVREIGGEAIRFSFLLPTGSRNLSLEVKAFALELRRVGILLDTVQVDGSLIPGRIEEGNFDLAAMIWEGMADEDPRLLCGAAGDFQCTGYRPERFTALVEQIREAASPSERRPLWDRLGMLLASERPVLFLYRHEFISLVAKRVHGLWTTGDRLDFRSAWVDP